MRSPDFNVVTDGFTAIPLAPGPLNKITGYARLAGRNEVYGFLLAPLDSSDGVIRDVLLARDQVAGPASAGIDARAAGRAKAEIEAMGCRAVGFWHSHGNLPVFHSTTDDANLEQLVRSLAGNNEQRRTIPSMNGFHVDSAAQALHYKIRAGEIVLKLAAGSIACHSQFLDEERIRAAGEGNIVLAITEDLKVLLQDGHHLIRAEEPRSIEIQRRPPEEVHLTGLAYSIVVNSRGDTYCELAVSRWCSFCDRSEVTIHKNLNLKTIETDNGESVSDTELMIDLEERVRDFVAGKTKGGLWPRIKDTLGMA
jgi:hypothetical protein